MRPIRRNASPITVDFEPYTAAKPELLSRLGSYCSYCERPIKTNLAVEHIEPKKGEHGQSRLKGKWINFLLACVNCNSTKGDKQVILQNLLLPDRDNTSAAFIYTEDGRVAVKNTLTSSQKTMAENILKLVGLDKRTSVVLDSNGQQVAIDRVAQRMEATGKAKAALAGLNQQIDNNILKGIIVELALATGFFSVWMTIFDGMPDMKLRFIHAFKGTEQSGCFEHVNAHLVSPAPNPDRLSNGGKV